MVGDLDNLFIKLNKEHEEKEKSIMSDGFKAMYKVYSGLREAGFSESEAVKILVEISNK